MADDTAGNLADVNWGRKQLHDLLHLSAQDRLLPESLLDILFDLFLDGNIAVRLQDRFGPALFVSVQAPMARDNDLFAVPVPVFQFAFPHAALQDMRADLFEG